MKDFDQYMIVNKHKDEIIRWREGRYKGGGKTFNVTLIFKFQIIKKENETKNV